MKIYLKIYSLNITVELKQFSSLFEFVYINYVFQSLDGLTVLDSNLEALYQIHFRLKLLAVY